MSSKILLEAGSPPQPIKNWMGTPSPKQVEENIMNPYWKWLTDKGIKK